MNHMANIFAAYCAAWLIFVVYYFTVARRVARLRDDIERLKQSIGSPNRR
jgi:CcmD family protein